MKKKIEENINTIKEKKKEIPVNLSRDYSNIFLLSFRFSHARFSDIQRRLHGVYFLDFFKINSVAPIQFLT